MWKPIPFVLTVVTYYMITGIFLTSIIDLRNENNYSGPNPLSGKVQMLLPEIGFLIIGCLYIGYVAVLKLFYALSRLLEKKPLNEKEEAG